MNSKIKNAINRSLLDWTLDQEWDWMLTLALPPSATSVQVDRNYLRWISEIEEKDGALDFRWAKLIPIESKGLPREFHALIGGIGSGEWSFWSRRWPVLFGVTEPESSGFTNKTAALRAEAKRRMDLLDHRAGFKQVKLAPKFEDHVAKFLEWSQAHHRPKTRELHGTNCDTLSRFFRGCWLDEITTAMVEEFKLARAKEERKNAKDGSIISPVTVNRALTTLKLLFHHAEKCGYAASNPTKGVAYLPEGSGRMRVVTFEEELSYLAKASQPLKDIAQIILDTGLRPEETFRIRVECLDFTARTIFNPFGKTKAARRKVIMTADVHAILKDRAKAARGPFVFPSKSGASKPIGSVRKAHDKAVKDAGITDHFRLYDLRHTFATRAVAGGVDLPTLSAMLGHTSISMTMRYVHPAEEQKKIAAGKLEAFRIAGIVEAIEKTKSLTTQPTTVN